MNVSITGPSGVGKTTVIRALAQRNSLIKPVISVTTRPPREGERDGMDYIFMTQKDWNLGEWVLVTQFQSHAYGIASELLMPSDEIRILNIDEPGVRRLRALDPKAHAVLMLSPSAEHLRERLHVRGEPEYSSRFSESLAFDVELYDKVIINDRFDVCVDQLHAYLESLVGTAQVVE